MKAKTETEDNISILDQLEYPSKAITDSVVKELLSNKKQYKPKKVWDNEKKEYVYK